MSRCFPYPPPGYTLSRARNDALIESIKLQKEKVKAKEHRKNEKREKKEKKKEKRKEKKDKTSQNLDKSAIVQGHIDKTFLADTKGESRKGKEAETEQVERSSLTEEHGQPVCLRAPSTSSDSTENSNKRKRHSIPIDGIHGHGNIIRIRLPSKKQNESGAPANEQRLCSTSGRTHLRSQNEDNTGLRAGREIFCSTSEGTSNIGQGFTLRTNRQQICSTSGQIEAVPAGKTGIPSAPNAAAMTSLQRMELQFKSLIENLVPPPLQGASLDSDDQDWLFQGKKQEVRAEKRQRSGNDSISCFSSSALCPRAHYLPEIDAYALPFTVPF